MNMRGSTRGLARRGLRPAHYALRRTTLWALRPVALLRPAPRRGDRPRVRFLLQHAHGSGGTIRTVLNLSGHLAREHDVEIVSVLNRRATPFFPVADGVRIVVADDRLTPPSGRAGRLLARVPSLLTPVDDASFRSMNLRADLLLLRALWRRPPDVVIGTRPSLNLLVAELAPRGTAAVGQDHMNLASYRPALRRRMERAYRRLALLAVLTERTRAEYAAALAGAPTRLEVVPNALPELGGGPSRREHKVLLAAGRYTRQKGFDLLLDAYAPLAAEHPDWTLRIFGAGPMRDQLRKRVADLGLAGRAEVGGRTAKLGAEMERAAVYVLSSRFEGLPMVVLEAMSKGLPVVAFDCPTGPAEVITDGEDGLLVPAEDVAALTAALRRVMGDADLRDRLGERALRTAEEYRLDRIGPRWARLIAELRP
ncbi:glycosyltransferase family 4 protein [Actinomadura kijaniata]|uniref:glycosyltransferase family 4 protein n=1 Tax=Actinomadura kijaniata TaxID=46161 RepID=UPI000A850F5A|nr:glycosyltransferase family 4 protein [Actinomadura kijaniata]